MAEVALYSTSMIQQTNTLETDKEVVKLIWSSSFGAKLKKWNLSIRNWIYPAHLEGLWLVTGVVSALYFGDRQIPFDAINRIVERMPRWTLFKNSFI